MVEIALAARKSVLKTAKECSELVYATYCISDAFTFTGKLGQAFIHIATYGSHVNLGFNYGTSLPDPENLLVGTGKSIRHIRLDSKSQLKTKPVKNLIAAAIKQGIEMAENKGGVEPAVFKVIDSRK